MTNLETSQKTDREELKAHGLELLPSPIEEYSLLQRFYLENQLEISLEDPAPEGLVQSWKVVPAAGGGLIGAVTLALRQGEFIIDGIAVDQTRRKARVGAILLGEAIRKVREMGGKRIYLVARAPGFFRKSGFVAIPRDAAPNFFECLTCPQYGVDCHPEVMLMEV